MSATLSFRCMNIERMLVYRLRILSCGPRCLFSRTSTDTLKIWSNLRVETDDKARAMVKQLLPQERSLLLEVLEKAATEYNGKADKIPTLLERQQVLQLFAVNLAPFVGFGILDNMIMIFAGEYIDQTIGAWLAISTMAAAALGNIISDVGGIGLAHYVEFLVSKAGLKHPLLTPKQLESSYARIVINTARAIGLVIGCLIGMFPLLFFDSK